MPDYETRTIHSELRFGLDPDERPRIDGRPIVYNSLSEDLGGWKEIILPGAVRLEDDLRALFDHDTSMVLGRTKAKTLEAHDDGQGIVMTAYPPKTTWADDLRVSMDRGDIDQMSFRMMVFDDKWEYDPTTGIPIRQIQDCIVSEFSVVAMPAYPATTAEARDLAAEALAARVTPTDNGDAGGAPGDTPPDNEDGASSPIYVDGIGFVDAPKA